ncbi:hypothetical protein [Sulfurimonas sp. HSL-1716]|uniref:hypothetical protein n=1 Tax=Hydrocurvibacter sulfurireducens TaxID=3131937 RepID=UPI0031F8B7BE
MFKSNEQYACYEIIIKDDLEEKIHEFNHLLMTAINLMPCLPKGRIKKKLKTFLNVSDEELLLEKLDNKIKLILKESLFEKIESILHTTSKCEVIIPDKKVFVMSNMKNDLDKKIIRKINHKILSELFESSYAKLDLDNKDLETIIQKFADTQKIVDEINFHKISYVDFVGIQLEDINKELDFENVNSINIKYFENYVHIKKCYVNFERIEEIRLDYLNKCDLDYIIIGDFIFPFKYEKFRSYIKQEKQAHYDFQYIKINLDHTTADERHIGNLKRKTIKEAFLKYFRKDGNNTAKILASLENNFYIKNTEKEEDFFEKSYLIKKNIPKDDHSLASLKHFQFIVPYFDKDKNKAFFGIYNDNKSRNHEDQSQRGLSSWINKNGVTCNYSNNKDSRDEVCEVMTLEPKYSFYYQQHFFEDLLDELFKEMKGSSKITDILYSVKLNEKEFDFILLTDDNKIFVVEAKTKLTGYYIERQLKKFNDLHKISSKYESDSTKTLLDEYIIIGFNSDETCKDKFNFFIEKYPINGNALQEHDKAYSFKVPISGQKDKELYCIADIYYDNLKSKIEESLKASS